MTKLSRTPDDNVKPNPSQDPSGGKGSGSSGNPSKIDVPTPTQPGAEQETFIDLDGYDWAKESIYSLARAGILNGYGDGTFRPGESVTRAQFVKMLVMASGLYDASAQVGTFTDISEGDWYYPYIAAAYQAGIVKGVSETEFGPDALLTREQMTVMLYRAAQAVGINVSGTAQAQSFTDSDEISDYAKIPVTKLSQSGIINGMGDGRFAPKETANRAMAAKVMHGMFSLRKQP